MKIKDFLNKQLLTFVIGLLVGCIITTGVFLIIRTKDRPKMPNFDPSSAEKSGFDKSNFDRSKFPKRQKSNESSETNKENENVETGA